MSDAASRPHALRHHLGRRWERVETPILVVGDAMLDVYISGAVDRISPEAPVPVVRHQEQSQRPGGAANVALNIATLGGACRLVAAVGADAEGARLGELLRQAGVACDLVADAGRPTTLKTRITAGQHQLLRLDRDPPGGIAAGTEAALVAAIGRAIEGCRLVVLSDYGKGTLSDAVIACVLERARANGIDVVVDPKRRDLAAYRGAALIKPNRAELQAATGLPVAGDADVARAAHVAAQATGARILVTRSEAGMTLVAPDGATLHMPGHVREVYDVTGAGDSAMAALAIALVSGRPVEDAVAFANLAGGIAVARQGAASVSLAELEAERTLIAEDHAAASGEVVDAGEAVRLRQLWKSQGLTVGFTNGCFDLLHPGHVHLLQEAARACDRLIVGLNSDASVRRLKGPERPVQDEDARAAVLGAMEHVNLVVIFGEDTPLDLIKRLAPDLLVKGADYTIDQIVGADAVVAAGGRVMRVDVLAGHSTTRLIGRQRPATGKVAQ
jgi:D-beta-D-heptose 7-phosphate kinase/D-beta-D-heptose 1-phosphate adenosyltransferase